MVKLTVILSIFVLAGAFAAFLIWGGGLFVSPNQTRWPGLEFG